MSTREREIANWVEMRRQLNSSGLTRREVARMGLLAAGAGMLVGVTGIPRRAFAWGSWGRTSQATSPTTTPWAEAMPIPPVLQPVTLASLGTAPNGPAHQYWSQFPPAKYYKMTAQPFTHGWAPEIPADANGWGYEGTAPGPTIDLRYGEPVLIRHVNNLPDASTYKGWGYPGSITHLHNFHAASESDGGPWRYTLKGEYTDHHYCMNRAGFSLAPSAIAGLSTVPAGFAAPNGSWWAGSEGGGDLRETLTSLFYHQHMPGYTASNVYKGLAGFCRVFDSMDNGNETNTSGWQLPSGKYDVPMVFADKQFDASGQLYYDALTTSGFLGDKSTVNGKIQPYFVVDRRKYRFRLLDAGPSRFYNFVFRTGGNDQKFTQITDNGNLLPNPRTGLTQINMWVGERSDVIFDFSAYPDGTEIILANTLAMQSDGAGSDRFNSLNPDDPANQIVKFVVRGATAMADPSKVPSAFRPLPTVVMSEVVAQKSFTFDQDRGGGWTINGATWDPDVDHTQTQFLSPNNKVKRNTAELWTLQGRSRNWEHPIHIHFEEGLVTSVNGQTQTPTTRQDIYRLTSSGTTLQVFMRFRDYPDPNFSFSAPAPVSDLLGDTNKNLVSPGRYVMHCHNTVHEDHAMMTSFTITP